MSRNPATSEYHFFQEPIGGGVKMLLNYDFS
jgi:hypothetical protein